MWAPLSRTRSRCSVQALFTPDNSCRNWPLGKYVPAKNGSPSGVRMHVIGHPPCPVRAVVAAM